jgi:hypothetical protein
VKRALTTSTSVRDELQLRVREAQDLGRQRDFEQGIVALRLVGQLTKQAIAEADASPAAVGADQTTSPMEEAKTARRQQWEQRLAELEPHYSDAVNSANSGAGKLRIVMDYSRAQAERGQFVKALVGLDRLAQLLGESK